MNLNDQMYAAISYIIENGGRYGEKPNNFLRPFTLYGCSLDKYDTTSVDYEGNDDEYGITCTVDYIDITGGHHYAEVSMSYAQILAEITDIVGTNFI